MVFNERVPFENLKLPASTMPVSCRVEISTNEKKIPEVYVAFGV